MEPRPYQQEAVLAVKRNLEKGYKSPLVIMATGLGKTVVAHEVIKNLFPISEHRTMFLVSMQDLVRQTRRAFSAYSPEWEERSWTVDGRPGLGIVMGTTDQSDARVVIGTPQTLGGEEKKPDLERLERVLDYGQIDLLAIDEAHMSISKTFMRIVEKLRSHNPNMVIVGYTATPWRSDGLGLNNLFDVIAINYNIRWGINHNYLCSIRDPLQIETNISFEGQASSDEDIAAAIDVRNWSEIVLKAYLEHGENRLALGFMPSVKHSREFARYCHTQGIECAHVDSEMVITPTGQELNSNQRYSIYQWYESERPADRPRILVNYNVLTTGWDCPAVSCILWSRPTLSDLIMVQGIGRGTRKHSSKDDLLIMDFALKGLKLVSVSDITGLSYGSSGETAEKEEEQLVGGLDTRDTAKKGSFIDGKGVIVKIGKLIGHSKNAWYSNDVDNTMSLACGDKHTLVMVPPYYTLARRVEEGLHKGELAIEKDPSKLSFYRSLQQAHEVFNNYTIWHVYKDGSRWKVKEKPILVDDNPMSLFDRSAAIEDHLIGDDAILAKKNKQWRRRPPSDKQIEMLRRLGCYETPENMGRAAQMITHWMAAPRVFKEVEQLRKNCKVYGVLDHEMKELTA